MTLTIPHLPGRPTHGRRTKEPMMASTTIHSLLQEKIQCQAAEIERLTAERSQVRQQVFKEIRIMTVPELLDEAKYYANHFQPAIEDDNNYYRGQCGIDGKDAADIGELCASVVKLIEYVNGEAK